MIIENLPKTESIGAARCSFCGQDIYGTNPDVSRGEHSHYDTKQYLIAVNGSCKITLDWQKDKHL